MTSETPVVPPDGPAGVSTPRVSKKVAVRLAVVGAAVVVGIGVLVAQTSKPGNASPAKWVVVPRTPPRGPGGTVPSAPSSSTVTLGANVVTIPVPQGWTSGVSDDKTGVDLDGGDVTAYFFVVSGNSESASTLVSKLPADFLNSDNTLSNVVTYPAKTAAGTGLVTGQAQIVYTAVEKTDSGSVNDVGNLFTYTRNDGWVMDVQLVAQGSDTTDAGKKLTTSAAVSTLLTGAYKSFARV